MAGSWVEAEFETIFREHYERIARITQRVLGSDGEAEEVCAEVFLRLYRAGPEVAAGGQVGGWLYRTATRAAIDALRSNQRRGIKEELDSEVCGPTPNLLEGPLHRLLRNERIAGVRAVLASLNRKKAQILLLRHSGCSYQEIAEAMRISPASIGTMLARAEAEFLALYEKRQQRRRSAPQLQTAKEGR